MFAETGPGPQLEITYEDAPSEETISAFQKGLDDYNTEKVGPMHNHPLWLIVRGESGRVIGGLKGRTFWQWLFIEWLWIDAPYRHQGLGRKLLTQAEAIARGRGSVGIYIDTLTFQAPDYYQRFGFKEFGRLCNIPPGHDRLWLFKPLGEQPTL
jgi:GNAT superfamily N-acetyltransferase